MRILVGFAFCFALLLSSCSKEEVKTDPKTLTPPTKPTGGARQAPGPS